MTLNNVAFSKNQRRREVEGAEKQEQELRQLLHNTVDTMTFEQLQMVAQSLNLNSEFDE